MKKPSKTEKEHYKTDYRDRTVFQSYARLLQSKWRDKKGYDAGKYGNFLLPEFAREEKANFLTDRIKTLVEYEMLRKPITQKMIQDDRMWENLLSSQPLCFNLFGEMHFDMKLASKVFRKLFPKRVHRVTDIIFEHSPGRRDPKYTNDKSAFDVFIEYVNGVKRGFVGIEVKYIEDLTEESLEKAEKNFKERYVEISKHSGCIKMECIEKLKKPPLAQIWRDHLLSKATLQDYDDEGFFIYLYPKQNKECDEGVKKYIECLVSKDEEVTGFYPRYLEDFVDALEELDNSEWIKEFGRRYLERD